MATTKGKAKAKLKRPPVHGAIASPKQGDDSLRRRLDAAIRRWPPISDLQRMAFTSQFDEARCELAGRETDSLAVAREAIAWIERVELVLRANAIAARRYPPARLVFLVECVRELLRMRTLQHADDVGAASRAIAIHDAKLAREELLRLLESIAGERANERAAIDAARRTATTEDDLARSLYSLADLADGWLGGAELTLRALSDAFGLAQADVDRARAAADRISSAVTFARLGAPAMQEDAPEVDRIEGRVLMELRVVRSVFERAHEVDASVPLFEPTAATRVIVAS